jgi:uncharacterized protein RhaS with RHS repeats
MKYLAIFMVAALGFTSCKNSDSQGSTAKVEQQAKIDSLQTIVEKQRVIDSKNVMVEEQKAAAERNRKEVVVVNQTSPATSTRIKGWSSTAKGAVIGAGVGAATGAIISKKKGQGAIIGGLAGAGIGAGTGAIIDGNKK